MPFIQLDVALGGNWSYHFGIGCIGSLSQGMFRVLSMLKMAHFQEHIIDCKEKTENLISRSLPHYLGRSLGKKCFGCIPLLGQTFPHKYFHMGQGEKHFKRRSTTFGKVWVQG